MSCPHIYGNCCLGKYSPQTKLIWLFSLLNKNLKVKLCKLKRKKQSVRKNSTKEWCENKNFHTRDEEKEKQEEINYSNLMIINCKRESCSSTKVCERERYRKLSFVWQGGITSKSIQVNCFNNPRRQFYKKMF